MTHIGVRQASGASHDAGFTLIEVTVVVAILSILSVGALFAVSREPPASAGIIALTKGYNAARTNAISSHKPVALQITATGWSQQIWQSGKPDPGADHWEPAEEERRWDTPPMDTTALPVRITFLPTGRSSGVALRFRRANGAVVSCDAQAWDSLQCSGL